MPSLRRVFSSPAGRRSAPYSHPSSPAASRAAPASPSRRPSASSTASRRVLADIDWWLVLDGQRPFTTDASTDDDEPENAPPAPAPSTDAPPALAQPADVPEPAQPAWIAGNALGGDAVPAAAPTATPTATAATTAAPATPASVPWLLDLTAEGLRAHDSAQQVTEQLAELSLAPHTPRRRPSSASAASTPSLASSRSSRSSRSSWASDASFAACLPTPVKMESALTGLFGEDGCGGEFGSPAFLDFEMGFARPPAPTPYSAPPSYAPPTSYAPAKRRPASWPAQKPRQRVDEWGMFVADDGEDCSDGEYFFGRGDAYARYEEDEDVRLLPLMFSSTRIEDDLFD